MCGGSTVSVKEQRYQNIVVHRRLSDMLSIAGTSGQRFRYGDKSSHGSRVQYKLGKEPSGARTVHRVPGSQHKLSLLLRHAIGGEVDISNTVPLPLQARESRVIQTMPTPARPHGVSNFCCTSGATDDEGCSALGRGTAPMPTPSSQPQVENNIGMCGGSPAMERHSGSCSGGSAGCGGVQSNHDNGRVPVRMGSDHVGQNGEWEMGSEPGSFSYKCSGALGSVSSIETFPAFSPGSSCPGKDRQLHCGGIRKPPRRHSVTAAARISSDSNLMEQHPAPVSSSYARTGRFEQRSGSPVPGESPVRRVKDPPAGGGPDLAEIRQGSRRSIRLVRKRAMSTVFLPVGRKCTSGCGCFSAPVAGRAALCVSPAQPDLPDSYQSERAGPVINHDSATVAVQTLVGRNNIAAGGRAVAAPHT